MEAKRQIGRPRGTTAAEDELLAAIARQSPTCTAMELLEKLNLPVSRSTVYRRLTEAGVNIRPAMGKPSQPFKKIFKTLQEMNGNSKLYLESKSEDRGINVMLPYISSFVPILPKPSNHTVFTTTAATSTTEKVEIVRTGPSLETLCNGLSIGIPSGISLAIMHPFQPTKCAVLHCAHSQVRNPELFFFPFPKDAKRCASWVITCNRLDLFQRDIESISKNCILCEDHFEYHQYHCTANELPVNKKRLLWNAVPTIMCIPSRPPKENYVPPELYNAEADILEFLEYVSYYSKSEENVDSNDNQDGNQGQMDDFPVIVLPSPSNENCSSTRLNGEAKDNGNYSEEETPDLTLICEVDDSNDQILRTSRDEICIESPESSLSPCNPEFLSEEEDLPAKKKIRLDRTIIMNYTAKFDLLKTIRLALRKTSVFTPERSEIKTLTEKWKSLEENKNKIENVFKNIDEGIAKLKAEFDGPNEEAEIIDISDDDIEIQENSSSALEGFLLRNQYRTVDKEGTRRLANDGSTEIAILGQVAIARPKLPSIGRVERSDLKIGMPVIASKLSFQQSWCRAIILDALNGSKGEKLYRIRFDGKKNGGSLCTGKQLAYVDNPWVILPVGSRIIDGSVSDQQASPEC